MVKELLHGWLFGHFYRFDREGSAASGQAVFVCDCGAHWFPGFGWTAIRRRDDFAPFYRVESERNG